MRRAGLLLIAGLVLVPARPAAAHGAGGIEATNYQGTVGALDPGLDGVRLAVVAPGDRLELRNDGAEVVVQGDGGEPYLRVGPDGAFENRASPAAARSRARQHEPAASAGAVVSAPPDWRKVAESPVIRWHEHRLHRLGTDPPEVAAEPRRRQVVDGARGAPATVTVRQGAATATAAVRLTWVPGPSPAPWFALSAVTFLGVAALGLVRRWRAPLAATIAILLGVDLLHAAAAAFATAGGLTSHLARVVTGDFYAVAGWVLAVTALRLLLRHRVDGLYAAVFAGLSIALFGGVLDLVVLSRSTTLFALPIEVARLCIALAAGGGAGLVVAAILVIRRTPEARIVLGDPSDADADADADGAWQPVG